mgnify:CR=1 FL=1
MQNCFFFFNEINKKTILCTNHLGWKENLLATNDWDPVELSRESCHQFPQRKLRSPQNCYLFWVSHLVGKSSFKCRTEYSLSYVIGFNKGDFCLIGLSNLEFHWLIHWNLVNSFESREDDCQLCHTSTVGFPLSSFLFVYAIMTRFECKLLVLWILWLLLILYGGKFFNWKKIVGNDRQRYKTW